MNASNCIFCKIISKEIPSAPILETEYTIVIKDLHPRAPIHYLLLPKIHVEHMGYLTAAENPYIVDLGLCVAELSRALPKEAGFNVVSNNGKAAGQSVFHLHWHFLSGRTLCEEGGLSLP
jgi:histidine triad (HIT) family protein